jgi:hypothetical protein
MTFKNKVIYLSVAIAVGVISFILGMVFSPDSVAGRIFKHPVFADYYKKNITAIDIKFGNQEIYLENLNGENWQVRNHGIFLPADSVKVDTFLTQLLSFKKVKKAAASSSHWGVFNLEEGNGYSITITDGIKRRNTQLVIGKTDTVTGGDFFKETGSDDVWLSGNSIMPYLYLENDQWSNLFLLSSIAEKDTIASLKIDMNIAYSDSKTLYDSYSLVRNNGTDGSSVWSLIKESEKATEIQKILVLIRNLINLKAKSYVLDKNLDTGMNVPSAKIQIVTDGGKKVNLLVGKREGQVFFIYNESNGYTFRIEEWAVKQIFPASSELLSQQQ